ncbi:MAG: hypothetical protein IKT22_07985 [Prevotella sp.]|nr:hypothetical protein [Prevotella sp.]MBR6495179.1 hypothetical protein [Prevotella sp.]
MRKLRNNILLACCLWTATATAQIDSIPDRIFESEEVFAADSLIGEGVLKGVRVKKKRDWASWRPETKRAMWLSIVLPGAGQIYNRKYWKLPIIYGGFVGCAYAMRWNNQMYHDYSQAYMDLMDDDPKTESYNQFMHLGAKITDANITRYQELFRKRKDRYRRWRDLSFFVMVGVYALSVVDAYVDASLSEFDISDDLSLEVSPAVMGNPAATNPYKPTGIGLQCSLTF